MSDSSTSLKSSGWLEAIQLYGRRRIIVQLLLGFSAGLPLSLLVSTLGIWLAEAGLSTEAVTAITAVTTPYSVKFLWAPLVDVGRVPWLAQRIGARRAWLVLTQVLLVVLIAAFGQLNPATHLELLSLLALAVAIVSATQDIVIDAFRIESLPVEEQGAGAASYVFGYRVGMLAASAGALVIVSHFQATGLGGAAWSMGFLALAAAQAVGLVGTLLGVEDRGAVKSVAGASRSAPVSGLQVLQSAVVEPFVDFMKRTGWVLILLLVFTYKFSDQLGSAPRSKFLMELGFTKVQLAAVVNTWGFAAIVVGGLLGGALVKKLGVSRSLWLGAIVMSASNLMFAFQYRMGADPIFLAATMAVEQLAGGFGTAAFTTWLGALCNRQFAATQYALLSALSSLGRPMAATMGGLVTLLGWWNFYIVTALVGLPSLLLIVWERRRAAAREAVVPDAGAPRSTAEA